MAGEAAAKAGIEAAKKLAQLTLPQLQKKARSLLSRFIVDPKKFLESIVDTSMAAAGDEEAVSATVSVNDGGGSQAIFKARSDARREIESILVSLNGEVSGDVKSILKRILRKIDSGGDPEACRNDLHEALIAIAYTNKSNKNNSNNGQAEGTDNANKKDEKKTDLEPSQSPEIDNITGHLGEILQGEIDNFHDLTSWGLKVFFWCKGWKCDGDAAKTMLSNIAHKDYRNNLYNFLEAVVKDGKKGDDRFAGCKLSTDENVALVEKTGLAWAGRFLNLFHKTPEAVINSFAGSTALLCKFRWLMLRIPGVASLFHVPFLTEGLEATGGWAGRYVKQVLAAKKEYAELTKKWKSE